jgi:hypothetical protein
MMPQTNLRKNLIEIIKQLFVHLWHILFCRRRFFKDLAMFLGFWPIFDLKMKLKVKYHN